MMYLCSNLWTAFSAIATAVSAIATAFMAVYTYKSIQNSKEQLAEMKKQWEEDNKPILEVSPIVPSFCMREDSLALEIRNLGKSVAKEVRIFIEPRFIENFPCSIVKDSLNALSSQFFNILPNDTKKIPLCIIHNKKYLKDHWINNSKLKEKEYYDIVEYLSFVTFKVTCVHKEYKSEHIITSNDLSREKFNYLSFLEEIEYDLSSIKSTLEQQSDNI